jgi:RNA polymerase sigma-70 factor (ECF subfamily)
MVEPHPDSPARSPMQPASGENAGYLSAALAGDSRAFELLTEPYRRELLTHCYRMLGSLQDAEDLVQETLLRAWRRLSTYEGRASLRSWLYKISTNACLDALARRPRRLLPPSLYPQAGSLTSLPAPVSEPIWLDPFPDELQAPEDIASAPEARFEARESISLSFLVALQLLPPRQRCVLILCDVLDWQAGELAEMLGTSVGSVNSLLHRARVTLGKNYHSHRYDSTGTLSVDQGTRALLDRYLRAWESADMDEIVALLRENTIFAMPPFPLWLQGQAAIRTFISAVILNGDAQGRWRLLPIRANGGSAFAWYQKDDSSHGYQAFAIQVLSLDAGRVAEITTFVEKSLFRFFNLPSELPI